MSSLADFLTRPRTLWLLLAATVGMTLAFPLLSSHLEMQLLDGVSSPDVARDLLGGYTAEQRAAHAWITATLDVAYPLALAGLFAGSALFVFHGVGPYLAAIALLALSADLLEGLVQVLALTDVADLLGAKAVLTPAKLLLFGVGFCSAVAAWGTWVVRRVNGRS